MRNRAKCKLCSSIIESFHQSDYVMCKCGEIAVDAGDSFKCYSKDWNNFLRIDDEGNEIIVTTEPSKYEKTSATKPETTSISSKPTHKELLEMLDEMRKTIQDLPMQAMTTPINHYDWASLLILLSALFRSDCKDKS